MAQRSSGYLHLYAIFQLMNIAIPIDNQHGRERWIQVLRTIQVPKCSFPKGATQNANQSIA
jgi:hypothetical protein